MRLLKITCQTLNIITMKNNKNLPLTKRLATGLFFSALVTFSVNAQNENAKQVPADKINPAIALPAQELSDFPIEKNNIVVRMEDENGKEMKYIITRDEYIKIENKIREYEQQNGIIDRSKNVYIVNSKFEFIKVTNTKN